MQRSLNISNDVVDLGPEMFASSDLKVIGYKGENYYRSCPEKVYDKPEGGATFCVKPIGHVQSEHEDAFGRTLGRDYQVKDLDYKIRQSAVYILKRTGLDDSQIFNVLNALLYGGFILERTTPTDG